MFSNHPALFRQNPIALLRTAAKPAWHSRVTGAPEARKMKDWTDKTGDRFALLASSLVGFRRRGVR
jgi:hypothetical protein